MHIHKHYAAIVFVIALFAYSQAKARELYPGQYANAPHHDWYESQRNKAGSSCCLEADAHDYFGDHAINLDGSVLLKSGAIPIASTPTRSSTGQTRRGTQFGGTSIMGTGALRRSASRQARGRSPSSLPSRARARRADSRGALRQTDLLEPPGRRCGCWRRRHFFLAELLLADSGCGADAGVQAIDADVGFAGLERRRWCRRRSS